MKNERSVNRRSVTARSAVLALLAVIPTLNAASQTIKLAVAPNDTPLYYPSSLTIIPDEHTTIMPIPSTHDAASKGRPGYLAFVAANNSGMSGTFALETRDLVHFELAPGYGSPTVHSRAVLWPPNDFGNCNYTGAGAFDQNYAAPGSVVQDPTGPPGNFIMIYEAERHCPGGKFEFNYWASVGFARSTDFGKSWPQPSQYGPDRHAALTIQGAEPPIAHPAYGDALPSAFVDDVRRQCDDEGHCAPKDPYVYIVYYFNGSPTQKPDGYMRVARARLGEDQPLRFKKWFVNPATKIGGWTEEGKGGLDSGFTPTTGCKEPSYQLNGQISYVDALRLYLLTFVCINTQKQSDGSYAQVQAGWYFSTATSLERQEWTAPQLIPNSLKPITTDASGAGRYFDGWYPSFMSPGCRPGHLALSGTVFFLNGNSIGVEHRFNSRAFRIDVLGDNTHSAECELSDDHKEQRPQRTTRPPSE